MKGGGRRGEGRRGEGVLYSSKNIFWKTNDPSTTAPPPPPPPPPPPLGAWTHHTIRIA